MKVSWGKYSVPLSNISSSVVEFRLNVQKFLTSQSATNATWLAATDDKKMPSGPQKANKLDFLFVFSFICLCSVEGLKHIPAPRSSCMESLRQEAVWSLPNWMRRGELAEPSADMGWF